MRDDDALDPNLLDAWEVPEPPADLADRVLQALAARAPAAPPKRRWPWAVGGLAVAAAAVLLVTVLGGGREATGATIANHRQALSIGDRAVAVAEAGSALTWRVAADRAARVEQSEGNVFYRVERGGPFVVSTPAGDVTVLGTCFRVEVNPMRPSKQSVTGAALGAAAAAIVVVSVYEGKVLLANPQGRAELAAGDRALARGDSAPVMLPEQPAPAELAAPAANASREDLLRRDEDQRRELALLRDRVKRLEADKLAVPRGSSERPRFVGTSKEDLAALAAECRLGFDTPPLHLEPFQLDDIDAAELELTGGQKQDLRRRLDDLHGRVLAELRALYVEVTGDRERAEELSPTALAEEIVSKSPRQESQLIFQKLSRERAGMAPVPTDLRGTSPAERYYRLMTRLGGDFEKEFAQVIGPDRAHALRARDDGWGNKSFVSAGCPK